MPFNWYYFCIFAENYNPLMKIRQFILISFIGLSFMACNLTSVSNYKPEISFLKNPTVCDSDTLNIYLTDQANVYRLDTIHVGDTIRFKMFINAFTNNINEYTMNQSADSVSKFILPNKTQMDSIFTASSNYNAGIFYMKNKANNLFFPFEYVALKPSLDAKITFNVVSDANFEYNQNSFVLNTPIVAKKAVP